MQKQNATTLHEVDIRHVFCFFFVSHMKPLLRVEIRRNLLLACLIWAARHTQHRHYLSDMCMCHQCKPKRHCPSGTVHYFCPLTLLSVKKHSSSHVLPVDTLLHTVASLTILSQPRVCSQANGWRDEGNAVRYNKNDRKAWQKDNETQTRAAEAGFGDLATA